MPNAYTRGPAEDKPDFEEVDDGHQTATGSFQNAVSKQFESPQTIEEIMPYWRDNAANGSATDIRTLVAKDTSLTPSDAPSGALSDGDGWLELQSGNVASGGDGPDIAGAGFDAYTHCIVFQTKATSAQTTGRAQLTGTVEQ